jgi:hypothetical protein
MQQKELAIKEAESKAKQMKMLTDVAAQQDKIAIEEEKLRSKERIEGLKIGAKIATDKTGQSNKQQAEGLRIGVEVARETAQLAEREQDRERAQEAARQQAQQAQQTQQPQQPQQPAQNAGPMPVKPKGDNQ